MQICEFQFQLHLSVLVEMNGDKENEKDEAPEAVTEEGIVVKHTVFI